MRRLLLCIAAACSGGHAPPAHPERGRDAGPVAGEPPPSAGECDQLMARVLALAEAEQPGRAPADDDQVLLHARFAAECLGVSRRAWQCAMAAPTLAELAACDQASSRSSTSNSKVELGGMAPAAPRSP